MNYEVNNNWQFKDLVTGTIRNSFEKGNTIGTLMNKISKIFNQNQAVFKSIGQEAVWKERLDNLERYERCFDFLRSGFFKPQHKEWIMKLDTIVDVCSYTGNKYEVVTRSGTKREISERDYHDLKKTLY